MLLARPASGGRPFPINPVRTLALAMLFSAVGLMALSGNARAETLLDALASTYRNNPSLGAARESALAVGENLPRAEAGYKPRIRATGEAGYRRKWPGTAANDDGTSYGLNLQATQPVFDGFRTRNAVAQAQAQNQGAQQSLRNSEHSILLAAVKAYVQTFASRAILQSSTRYRAALHKQLKLVRSLHDLGDAVASDIAEVEARLAEAEAEQSRAQAAVEQSAAEYERIVGMPPGRVEAPPPLSGMLPASREKAVVMALAQHPTILAAQHAAAESAFQIGIVESEFAPRLDVVGSASVARSSASSERQAGLFAQLTIPIYSGGEVMARSRQAKYVASQRQLESRAAADRVNAEVTVAWSSLVDARLRIKAGRAQMKAASIALEGLRMAYKVGERSNFEVLDGERELYDAAIAQITAERDYVIATYAVSEATGTLKYSAVAEALRRQPKARPAAAAVVKPAAAQAKAKPRARIKIEPVADVLKCDSCSNVPEPELRASISD